MGPFPTIEMVPFQGTFVIFFLSRGYSYIWAYIYYTHHIYVFYVSVYVPIHMCWACLNTGKPVEIVKVQNGESLWQPPMYMREYNCMVHSVNAKKKQQVLRNAIVVTIH